MRETRTSGSMSGEGKRGDAAWPKLPRLSSTLLRRPPNDTDLWHLYAGGESRPSKQDLAYDLSHLAVVAHLALPEVVLLEKRGDAFEHVPCGFQLGLIVISSQVLD